jgi:hypothetical protein
MEGKGVNGRGAGDYTKTWTEKNGQQQTRPRALRERVG